MHKSIQLIVLFIIIGDEILIISYQKKICYKEYEFNFNLLLLA